MKTLFTSNSGWVSFRWGEGSGLKSQVILQGREIFLRSAGLFGVEEACLVQKEHKTGDVTAVADSNSSCTCLPSDFSDTLKEVCSWDRAGTRTASWNSVGIARAEGVWCLLKVESLVGCSQLLTNCCVSADCCCLGSAGSLNHCEVLTWQVQICVVWGGSTATKGLQSPAWGQESNFRVIVWL